MPYLPDFRDTALFRPLSACPEASSSPSSQTPSPSPSSPPVQEPYHLLAQITDDMTITKPTLVCVDREGAHFALVFETTTATTTTSAAPTLDMRKLGFRKGSTVVVPNARRVVPEGQGAARKREFVRIGGDDVAGVGVLPGSLERVLGLSAAAGGGGGGGGETRPGGEGDDVDLRRGCDACGNVTGVEGGGNEEKAAMRSCTGCGRARYCSKVGFDLLSLPPFLREWPCSRALTFCRSAKSRGGVSWGIGRTVGCSRRSIRFGGKGCGGGSRA